MSGLDFTRLGRSSAANTATEPRRIFSALPSKNAKYSYPRDVQTEVWDRWHERRSERDLVIKMNTGGGKTVVGLLLLKSCLNEGSGPAVYVTPDIYLTEQVRAEASALGIETTDDPRSSRFLSRKALLVVNVYKLINGLSVFGVVGTTRPVTDVGAILIDDVHACVATLEQQFTLYVPATHDAYKELFSLLKDALHAQSGPTLRDLIEGDPTAVLAVPYWTWADHQEQVLAALHPHRGEDEFKFVWPLMAHCLPLCRAAVSAEGIEIRPPCPPVNRIPSLANAKRRVYLTATLADDSVLVTHFGAAPESISAPITPNTADDLGDRMILAPLDIFPDTTDTAICKFLAEEATHRNVVVIVPSRRRAEFWRPCAAAVHDSASIHMGVTALRKGHVGLVVLINKYDGIDLPGDACHLLALDGVPEAYGALDRIESLALEDSEAMIVRQIQRIEQGMGRGVRSNDDYCVVMLIGSRLTQRIHSARSSARFSPATRAQLKLSDEIADMLHGSTFDRLGAVADQCLTRDQGWVAASRDVLDGVTYGTSATVTAHAIAQREAFDLAEIGRYREAHHCLRTAIDSTDDRRVRGWLKQQAAAYLHFADPVGAQAMQTSAQTDNRALMKPMGGVEYTRLAASADQAERAVKGYMRTYEDGTALVVGLSAIIDDLVPGSDPTAVPKFEQAMHDLGVHLGFVAQRPERDTGEGPDILWLLGGLKFLIIECKSAVTTDFIARRDAAQLSHSKDWFAAKYDESCEATPVLVHRSATLHRLASPRPGTRVMTFERLEMLRGQMRRYSQAIATNGAYRDAERVAKQLNAYALNGAAFASKWTERIIKL